MPGMENPNWLALQVVLADCPEMRQTALKTAM